jgi:hypothetical protein
MFLGQIGDVDEAWDEGPEDEEQYEHECLERFHTWLLRQKIKEARDKVSCVSCSVDEFTLGIEEHDMYPTSSGDDRLDIGSEVWDRGLQNGLE